MIGFSIEFKKFYFVLRGPKDRVYLATGFAKRMPVMTPTCTYPVDDFPKEWIYDVEDDKYDED